MKQIHVVLPQQVLVVLVLATQIDDATDAEIVHEMSDRMGGETATHRQVGQYPADINLPGTRSGRARCEG